MTVLHALFVNLKFDRGISVGKGSDFNLLSIDIDGQGRPILRGTAIAGVLRHRLNRDALGGEAFDQGADAVYWFGTALGDLENATGTTSRVCITDALLSSPSGMTVSRVHHQRNRHTGVVTKGGLYAIEACPPGTVGGTALFVYDQSEPNNGDRKLGDGTSVIAWLARIFSSGITFGGNAARGVGLAKADSGDLVYSRFDLSKPAEFADYLEVGRRWRQQRQRPAKGLPIPTVDDTFRSSTLRVRLSLQIPRGQDLLVAEGTSFSPMRIDAKNSQGHWIIPGGTLRGLLRDWFNRLAARDGLLIDDSAENYSKLGFEARLRHPNVNESKDPNCPINRLFGTTSRAGRIQVTDGLAPYQGSPDKNLQIRKHVAVDRITGGAADKLLFENKVLINCGPNSPVFSFEIRIDDPTENEAKWLGQTLKSLHLGLLRIGSSKSSGRLEFARRPEASGNFAEVVYDQLK